MGAPNFLKILVQDIKLHYEQYMIYIKNGRRYAREWTDLTVQTNKHTHDTLKLKHTQSSNKSPG